VSRPSATGRGVELTAAHRATRVSDPYHELLLPELPTPVATESERELVILDDVILLQRPRPVALWWRVRECVSNSRPVEQFIRVGTADLKARVSHRLQLSLQTDKTGRIWPAEEGAYDDRL